MFRDEIENLTAGTTLLRGRYKPIRFVPIAIRPASFSCFSVISRQCQDKEKIHIPGHHITMVRKSNRNPVTSVRLRTLDSETSD